MNQRRALTGADLMEMKPATSVQQRVHLMRQAWGGRVSSVEKEERLTELCLLQGGNPENVLRHLCAVMLLRPSGKRVHLAFLKISDVFNRASET